MKIFLGGQEAIRGYLLQTIASLLESLKDDAGWTNLELEPEDDSEKVDIKFHYPDKERVIQVKSSINRINLTKIKKWCDELKTSTKADEYELKLFGPSYTEGAFAQILSGDYNGVKLTKPELIRLDNLIEICAYRISKFVFNEGNLITPLLGEDIVKNLITELLVSSTTKIIISREDLKCKIFEIISQFKDVLQVSVTVDDLKRIRSEYFEFLKDEINENPFMGISTDIESVLTKPNLLDYYIPAQLQKYDMDLKDNEVKLKKLQDRFEVNKVLHKNDRIILLGPPGSGKTTLLKRILLQCIESVKDKKINDNLELNYNPIYLRCKNIKINEFSSFSEILPSSLFNTEISENLEHFKFFINDLIFNKKAILIVDGLDEISDVQLRIKFVQYLLRFIKKRSSVKVLITSREPGFRILKDYVSENFTIFSISDLDIDGIYNLTVKWYRIFFGKKKTYQKEVDSLIDNITKTKSILELSKNPLLLTTLLFLKHSRGIIPANKTALYDEIINLLIKTWNIVGYSPLNLYEVKAQLSFLAYTMTIQKKNYIYQAELIDNIQMARKQMPDVLAYTKHSPEDFISRVESRSSLIILSGRELRDGLLTEKYEFKHKTFQEFLTAYAVVKGYYPNRKSTDNIITILQQKFTNDNWVEIIPMVAVLMGRDANLLIKALIENIKTNKETSLLFMDPSKKALFQCILDEVQIDKNLAKDTLLFILKSSTWSYIYVEKLLFLLKGKFKDTFIELIKSLFMKNENLIDYGDLLAQIYKNLYYEEYENLPLNIIKEQLESDLVQNQIKSLLSLMVFAADLQDINQIKSKQKEELYNLGNKIARMIIKCDEKIVKFCAIWAITQFLIKELWDPNENQEFYNRVLNLWIKEENEDINYILSWSVITLPIISKSKISIAYNDTIKLRIMKNLNVEPNDLYKFYKLQKSYIAALFLAFYLDILTPGEIVKKIISYFNVLINCIDISYKSKEIINRDFKPFIPLLRALGKPAEPLLNEFEDIMNLEEGVYFYPKELSKQTFPQLLYLKDDSKLVGN